MFFCVYGELSVVLTAYFRIQCCQKYFEKQCLANSHVLANHKNSYINLLLEFANSSSIVSYRMTCG